MILKLVLFPEAPNLQVTRRKLIYIHTLDLLIQSRHKGDHSNDTIEY